VSTGTPVTATLTDRAAARAADRARTRRRSRLRGALVLLVVLVSLIGSGWVLLRSSAFSVERVTVGGVQRLTADQVRAWAAIEPGTPLARLDTDAVVRRLAGLAPVRDVEVVRRWPRTVEIRVRERTAAAVQARGSSWLLVDRTGVGFATQDRRPRGLPLVSAPVSQGSPALRATLDVLEVLQPEVRAKVREVRAATPHHVSLLLTRGRTVVWGDTQRGTRKAAVLAVLLTRKASVYDVSAPDIPTTRR